MNRLPLLSAYNISLPPLALQSAMNIAIICMLLCSVILFLEHLWNIIHLNTYGISFPDTHRRPGIQHPHQSTCVR